MTALVHRFAAVMVDWQSVLIIGGKGDFFFNYNALAVVAVSIVGDQFNHWAGLHEKELGRFCLEGGSGRNAAVAAGGGSTTRGLEMTTLLAQGVVRTTQETEPLSVLGLIELNMSAAKAVLFFMTVDLGIVFSRVDWGA